MNEYFLALLMVNITPSNEELKQTIADLESYLEELAKSNFNRADLIKSIQSKKAVFEGWLDDREA